jgi:Bacterial extracellular solute-binding proteins, family 3
MATLFTILRLSQALLLLLMAAALPSRAEGLKVIYPSGDIPNDTRFLDVIEMLRTALEKTKAQYGPYELIENPKPMPKSRYFLELEQPNRSVNVVWNSSTEELEQRFLPIRIPLRKGLLGYRICFITKENQSKIDQIKTPEDLKKITFGQGIGWNDNAIYEAAGIEVVKAKYSQLFKMLAINRFDLFPRGVGEIFPEYEQNMAENPALAVEKNLLIIYPFPYYFFFNRQDHALKNRVEAGLRIMKKDGSFDTIFKKYYQASIEKANLKGRRIIRLKNPLLPKNTPLDDASLWYTPIN